jgi:hypothetical protein
VRRGVRVGDDREPQRPVGTHLQTLAVFHRLRTSHGFIVITSRPAPQFELGVAGPDGE